MSKRKKRTLVVLAVVFVLAVAVYLWQHFYLTLPEGEVKPGKGGEEAPAAVQGFDKFDVLLLGLDKRAEEPDLGERSDTIILVTLDTTDNYAAMLTVPRDTRIRYNDRWMKINEVYSADGAEGSVKAVEELLDTSIDRYAVVDFQGVIDLVDLLDGIDVDVPRDMKKPLEDIDLEKGPQHLNGHDALGYMRYRDGTLSDMDRSERQKEVLLQLTDKILRPANLLKLPAIANTALTYMRTDISAQEILALAKFGKDFMDSGIENQVLPGVNAYYKGGWYYVAYLTELGLPAGEAEKEYRQILQEEEARQAVLQEDEAEAAAEEEAAAGAGAGAGAGADAPAVTGETEALPGAETDTPAAEAAGAAAGAEAEAGAEPGAATDADAGAATGETEALPGAEADTPAA